MQVREGCVIYTENSGACYASFSTYNHTEHCYTIPLVSLLSMYYMYTKSRNEDIFQVSHIRPTKEHFRSSPKKDIPDASQELGGIQHSSGRLMLLGCVLNSSRLKIRWVPNFFCMRCFNEIPGSRPSDHAVHIVTQKQQF